MPPASATAAVERVAARTDAAGGTVLEVNEKVLGKITPARQSADGAWRLRAEIDAARRRSGPAGRRLGRARTRPRPRQSRHGHPHRRRGRGEGVILVGETVDPFSVEAVRATMGSVFPVPSRGRAAPSFLALAQALARPGGRHASRRRGRLSRVDYRPPVLLVMGNEQSGLSPELAAACDAGEDSDGRPGRIRSISRSRPA